MKSIIAGFLTLSLALAQMNDFASITLIAPDKAQTIYEHQLTMPSNNLGNLPNTVTFDPATTKKITDEIDCIDMGLSADLLPSDQPEVPIYAEASLTALKIGRISYPAKAHIIKVAHPFVCIAVSPEKKGWVHQRHIDTERFWKDYAATQQRIYQEISTQVTTQPKIIKKIKIPAPILTATTSMVSTIDNAIAPVQNTTINQEEAL